MSTQIVCSARCGLDLAKSQRARKEKKERQEYNRETKRLKEKIKTKPQLTAEAQKAFNRFIRARDHDQPCISCGAPPGASAALTGGRWDCGHYRSVGSARELRFEELNAHKQCKHCNDHLDGNHVEYRKRLIARIGADKLEWVEGPHQMPNHTHDELREIKRLYNDNANKLEKKIKEMYISA